MNITIPSQQYAVFIHKSKTIDLKTQYLEDTINSIYKYWLPKSQYKVSALDFGIICISDEKSLTNDLIDSEIKIYLPVQKN